MKRICKRNTRVKGLDMYMQHVHVYSCNIRCLIVFLLLL
jgi:hypothetical protein